MTQHNCRIGVFVSQRFHGRPSPNVLLVLLPHSVLQLKLKPRWTCSQEQDQHRHVGCACWVCWLVPLTPLELPPQASGLCLKGVLSSAHLAFQLISQWVVLKGREGMALNPFQKIRSLICFSKLWGLALKLFFEVWYL